MDHAILIDLKEAATDQTTVEIDSEAAAAQVEIIISVSESFNCAD